MKVRITMAIPVAAAFTAVNAAQVVEIGQPQVVNAPQVTEVTVNAVQAVPVVPVQVVKPASPRQGVIKHPDAPGKVTEVRDEHVEVIDDKLELVTRTVKQTETRVIGELPSKKGKKDAEVQLEVAAVAVAVAAPANLEPPALEAAETRRLIHYFCRCWKDGDYQRMWWAMSPRYRLKAKYEEFCAVFAEDAKVNGGLMDENIGQNERHDDWGATLDVELRFKIRRAQPRKVKVSCERTENGYRISECGIIPVDMNNL